MCNTYHKFEVLFPVQELFCDSKMRVHKECYCAYFFYLMYSCEGGLVHDIFS